MNQDLIRKIKGLKEIEPSQKWLSSARQDLVTELGPDNGFFEWIKQPQQFALAVCLLLIFLGGPWLALEASKASLPGDMLYSVKKVNEGIQMTVASEGNKTQLKVEFASRRLEELGKITEYGQDSAVKGIVADLKDNLEEASVYAGKIPESEIIAVTRKAQKIKEELDQTVEGASSEVQEELAEAEEANDQILTALNRRYQEIDQNTATSTDQEILIFLQELEDGTITTTDQVINGVGGSD